MVEKKFIFLAGHHRSGTSLLHEIIRSHKDITGLTGTNVPEDEGQHVQGVFKAAKAFGGPGKYIFDEEAYMDESHELVSDSSSQQIFADWSRYFNEESSIYIEKSPPNLIRTRFLQALFPNSKFIVILRHPVAVSYATQKWSKTSTKSLIEHTLRGYEIFAEDVKNLNHVFVLRYEDFVASPQSKVDEIFNFLNLESIKVNHEIRPNVNDKYFNMWNKEKQSVIKKITLSVSDRLERRFNNFGYSLRDLDNLPNCNILNNINPNDKTNKNL